MSATFPLTFCVAIVKAIKMWSLKKKMLKTNCYINRAMKLLQKKSHSSTYKNFQMCMISRTWKNMNVYTCSKLAGKKKPNINYVYRHWSILLICWFCWKWTENIRTGETAKARCIAAQVCQSTVMSIGTLSLSDEIYDLKKIRNKLYNEKIT